jgi:hypothetical protein
MIIFSKKRTIEKTESKKRLGEKIAKIKEDDKYFLFITTTTVHYKSFVK